MNFSNWVDRYSSTKKLFERENLENGDRYNHTQKRAEELLEQYSGFKTIPANRHGPSCLDGFLEHDGHFKVGYEVKSRNISFAQMKKFGSFVLPKVKYENCSTVCKLLKIPFIAVCYSIPDDQIRYWFLSDDRGNMVYQYKFQEEFRMNGINVPVYHLPLL